MYRRIRTAKANAAARLRARCCACGAHIEHSRLSTLRHAPTGRYALAPAKLRPSHRLMREACSAHIPNKSGGRDDCSSDSKDLPAHRYSFGSTPTRRSRTNRSVFGHPPRYRRIFDSRSPNATVTCRKGAEKQRSNSLNHLALPKTVMVRSYGFVGSSFSAPLDQ